VCVSQSLSCDRTAGVQLSASLQGVPALPAVNSTSILGPAGATGLPQLHKYQRMNLRNFLVSMKVVLLSVVKGQLAAQG